MSHDPQKKLMNDMYFIIEQDRRRHLDRVKKWNLRLTCIQKRFAFLLIMVKNSYLRRISQDVFKRDGRERIAVRIHECHSQWQYCCFAPLSKRKRLFEFFVNGRGDEFLVVKQDALNTIRVAAAPSFRRGSKPFFGHFNSLDSIEILRKWLYYGGDWVNFC